MLHHDIHVALRRVLLATLRFIPVPVYQAGKRDHLTQPQSIDCFFSSTRNLVDTTDHRHKKPLEEKKNEVNESYMLSHQQKRTEREKTRASSDTGCPHQWLSQHSTRAHASLMMEAI